jgi:plasmid maintenance system antidote protein VapI
MNNPIVRRLKEVLEEKTSKNPSFSLRSLARALKIPAATLSRILSEKRGMSLEMAQRIVQGLTPSLSEQRRLLKAYALEPKKAPTLPTRYRYLELSELERLNHWGHGALLEVLRGEQGIRSIATLAQATGLTMPEAERCLKNLEALKLVQFSVKRGWHSKGVNMSAIRWENSEPWKTIHQGYAARALSYFDHFQAEDATYHGITFLAPAGRIAEAKQRIREFAEELADDLSEEGSEILYRLNVQLFPLGKKPPKT